MTYLYGASGHAKVIIEILEGTHKKIGGLVDENSAITSLMVYPVVEKVPGNFNKETDSFIISVGANAIRKKLVAGLKLPFDIAIHPSANVSKSAKIGEGTVIMAGVSINADAKIGKHTILNTNCSVDHDCVIGDFVHLSPNVALAGDVTVEEGAHIGIGACVIQGIKIGKWATIGAGTVVIKDIPAFAVVVGNPGEIIKYHKAP
ncbi:MAG: acetyltransferase [Lutibacter sp.]|nr:acetyltransferase [Lutibacter sp.]